jgi:hypothetical protein
MKKLLTALVVIVSMGTAGAVCVFKSPPRNFRINGRKKII